MVNAAARDSAKGWFDSLKLVAVALLIIYPGVEVH